MRAGGRSGGPLCALRGMSMTSGASPQRSAAMTCDQAAWPRVRAVTSQFRPHPKRSMDRAPGQVRSDPGGMACGHLLAA